MLDKSDRCFTAVTGMFLHIGGQRVSCDSAITTIRFRERYVALVLERAG